MRFSDLSGQRFGRLLVTSTHESRRQATRQQIWWLCRCDCDPEKDVWVLGEKLRAGTTLSCGCLRDESRFGRNTHPEGSARFPDLKSRTPEYQRASFRQYYYEGRLAATRQTYIKDHYDELIAYQKQYRLDNAERLSKAQKLRYKANPDIWKRQVIRRRFRLEQRIPPWADLDALNKFYRERPPGHEVDHLIPLVGRTAEGYRISGLHVLNNLQYLSIRANRAKKQRMSPEEQARCERSKIRRPRTKSLI